jgi:hypothetical protein
VTSPMERNQRKAAELSRERNGKKPGGCACGGRERIGNQRSDAKRQIPQKRCSERAGEMRPQRPWPAAPQKPASVACPEAQQFGRLKWNRGGGAMEKGWKIGGAAGRA